MLLHRLYGFSALEVVFLGFKAYDRTLHRWHRLVDSTISIPYRDAFSVGLQTILGEQLASDDQAGCASCILRSRLRLGCGLGYRQGCIHALHAVHIHDACLHSPAVCVCVSGGFCIRLGLAVSDAVSSPGSRGIRAGCSWFRTSQAWLSLRGGSLFVCRDEWRRCLLNDLER